MLSRTLRPAALAFTFTIVLIHAAVALPVEQLTRIRDGFDARRDQVLAAEIGSPFPSPVCPPEPATESRCTWGKLVYAISAFTLHRDEGELRSANLETASAVERIPEMPGYRGRPRSKGTRVDGAYDFHFLTAGLLYRLVRAFGHNGKSAGLLDRPTQEKINALFWDYVSNECALSDARSDDPWRWWGSENHWAMRVETCWAGADLLRRDKSYSDRRYRDGSAAGAQYAAWTKYLIATIRAKLRHGIFIEFFSPAYAAYSLGTFYDYYDFAADTPKLRELAKALLDLWWTAWAQEQIGGVHGGSKARDYWKQMPVGDPMEGMVWPYLDIGRLTPASKRPKLLAALTSSYRLPLVTMDIARDIEGRGRYVVRSRQLGLQTERARNLWHQIDERIEAVARYSYVTPSFVMGVATSNLIPGRQADPVSSQNCWNGLIIAGDKTSRIYATTYRPEKKAYNDVFAMQRGSTQVVKRLGPPWSRGAGPLRVWFGTTGHRTERDGWVFIADNAYVAVRPVLGGYRWDQHESRWMIPGDPDSPVIIHAAERKDFGSFADFQNAVLRLQIERGDRLVRVATLHGGDIAFPLVIPGGQGVPLPPQQGPSIQSPFLVWNNAANSVTIKKRNLREVVPIQ